MNDLLRMLSGPDTIRLGWALVHFLWQGLLIGLLLEIALLLAGRKTALRRYLLCGLALVAMPVCLVTTYCALGQESSPPTIQPGSTSATASHAGTSPMVPPVVPHTLRGFALRETSAFALDRSMPIIVAIWLVGITILTGRKAGGLLVLSHLRRQGVSAPSEAITELFRKACATIGIDPRRVSLKISTSVLVPMTMGWLSPIVLFPATLLSGLSAGEIELLLAHELAHIRRSDYLVNLLQTVVETLFFYHPMTWWISHRMRQERESCCDDMVAAQSTDVLTYAKALLQLESIRTPGLVTAANGGSLLQRIQRLIGEPAPNSGMGLPLLLALIFILGLFAFFSVSEGQTNSPSVLPATITTEEAQRFHLSVFKDGKPIFDGADRVAAWVNGYPVLAVSVKQQTAVVEKTLKEKFSGDELKGKIAEARQKALEVLIDRQLIIDDFKTRLKGFIPKSYLDERINDVVHEQFNGDREAFLKSLAERNGTLENYRKEIEDTAIVGYMRSKNVGWKVSRYYRDHLDLFPQDELVNVTCVHFGGDQPEFASGKVTPAALAQQMQFKMKAGEAVSSVPQSESDSDAKPQWFCHDASGAFYPAFWPITWADVAKMKPGQVSDIETVEGSVLQPDGSYKKSNYYYIVRLNDRRSAKIAATPETTKQKEELLAAEATRVQSAWYSALRADAKIQVFTQE